MSVARVPELEGGGGFAPLQEIAPPNLYVLSLGRWTFSLSPFGVRDSRGWQGHSVLGPTVGLSVPYKATAGAGVGGSTAFRPPRISASSRSLGGRRGLAGSSGALESWRCHLVRLRRGSRFPVTAPEEIVQCTADHTRPCRAE